MRSRNPNQPRPFRVPLVWITCPVCIIGCVYLFVNGLPDFTQKWFLFWNAVGLVVYFAYSMRKSNLARAQKSQGS
jgi:APA family basic amino acid/polyamine antiporter